MKKNFASILITNFNKSYYLKKMVNSCLNQTFKKKEILIYDDCSSDDSIKILDKFKKKIKIIRNKKKRFKNGPLNQINGIIELIHRSQGEIIFFLDSDDFFKKKKLEKLIQIFKENKKLNFIQDTPFLSNQKKKMFIKRKKHLFSIWPGFYPTSSICVRRKFLINFLKFIEREKYPHLEIDARLSMFAYLKNQFLIINNSLTVYNYDSAGITSNYKKYSILWWKKRNEAFMYLKFLHKRLKISFFYGIDFVLTKLINFFI